MAYEALYRRYRPSRFADAFFGQEHVVAALRNAIEGDRVGHAYLFSGPRGTGKTTSARILAKALNCTNLQGGEPCDECDSCLAFQAGGSYDLHELDAASNNGVEAMRDLIGKVALGSPGRTKVYILDEVHMLSSGAENALLKTLEEPPPHVVFVLCTTEPNKVVPTIRSRTQHLEFSLLSAAQVGELVDHVVSDAGLEITAEDRNYVIRSGGGSARDTLSALDQVVAAGGAPQGGEHLEALFQALIDRDAPAALAAIDGALQAGRDAAGVGTSLLHELRTVFLATMRADLAHLPEAERERATARAVSMPPARITRALEVIGTSLIEMRQAPDPRVDLEVAIMRLTRVDLDIDPAVIVERLEAIEQQLAGGAVVTAQPAAAPSPAAPSPTAPTPAELASGEAVGHGHTEQHNGQGQPTQQHQAPAPQQTAPQQTAPQQTAPQQAAPQQATPQSAALGPGGRQRGAAIARAELERQGITPTKPQSAQSAPAPAQAPAAEPAATAGKTLADVRRERQAATQAGGVGDGAEVEANAAARRERQSAAQEEQSGAVSSEPIPSSAPQPAATPPSDAVPQPAATEPQAQPADSTPPANVASPAAPSDTPESSAPESSPAEPQAPPLVPEDAVIAEDASPATSTESAAGAEAQLAPAAVPAPAAATSGALPTLSELNEIWQPLLQGVSGRVKSRFTAGHFLETTADSAVLGMPNPVHLSRCQEVRDEIDQALAAQFGRPIPLTFVVDMVEQEADFFSAPPSGGAGAVDEAADAGYEDETVDVHDLVDATGDVPSAEDRVMATFENSVLLEDPSNQHPNQ